MEIKDRIKELRLSEALTQTQLAKELNKIDISNDDSVIYAQTVSYWENGRDPNVNALVKLSKFFDVTVDYILGLEKINSIIEKWYEEGLEYLRTENLREYFKSFDGRIFKTIIFMLDNYIAYFIDPEKIKKHDGEELSFNDLASMYYHYSISLTYKSLMDNSIGYNLASDKDESDLFLKKILDDKINIEIEINKIINDFSFGITPEKINEYLNNELTMVDGVFEDFLEDNSND